MRDASSLSGRARGFIHLKNLSKIEGRCEIFIIKKDLKLREGYFCKEIKCTQDSEGLWYQLRKTKATKPCDIKDAEHNISVLLDFINRYYPESYKLSDHNS